MCCGGDRRSLDLRLVQSLLMLLILGVDALLMLRHLELLLLIGRLALFLVFHQLALQLGERNMVIDAGLLALERQLLEIDSGLGLQLVVLDLIA